MSCVNSGSALDQKLGGRLFPCYLDTYVCTYVCMYVCLYVDMYMHIYMCVYVYVCIDVYICVCVDFLVFHMCVPYSMYIRTCAVFRKVSRFASTSPGI